MSEPAGNRRNDGRQPGEPIDPDWWAQQTPKTRRDLQGLYEHLQRQEKARAVR